MRAAPYQQNIALRRRRTQCHPCARRASACIISPSGPPAAPVFDLSVLDESSEILPASRPARGNRPSLLELEAQAVFPPARRPSDVRLRASNPLLASFKRAWISPASEALRVGASRTVPDCSGPFDPQNFPVMGGTDLGYNRVSCPRMAREDACLPLWPDFMPAAVQLQRSPDGRIPPVFLSHRDRWLAPALRRTAGRVPPGVSGLVPGWNHTVRESGKP